MRDKARISEFMNRLQVVWEEYPDMRFGQLIFNILSMMSRTDILVDPFYLEEKDFLWLIEEYQSFINSPPKPFVGGCEKRRAEARELVRKFFAPGLGLDE